MTTSQIEIRECIDVVTNSTARCIKPKTVGAMYRS